MKLISTYLVVLLSTSSALANLEPGLTYDARSHAMGGAGVALATGAGAAFHNTASITTENRLSASMTLGYIVPRLRAPLPLPGGETGVDSEFVIGFPAAFAVTLNPWKKLHIGTLAFVTAGGSEYQVASGAQIATFSMNLVAVEVQLPIAYDLGNGLSIGIAPRVNIASITTNVPQQGAQGQVQAETSLSGFTPLGVQIGIRCQLLDNFVIGFSYKSEMITTLTGDTSINDTAVVQIDEDAGQFYATPHRFVLGLALEPIKDLTVTGDLGFWAYSSVYRADLTAQRPEAYENVFAGRFGMEYVLKKAFPIRLGIAVDQSVTSTENVNPFLPAPGTIFGFSGGLGLRLTRFSVDLAVDYITGGKEVAATETNALPGNYESNVLGAVLTVAYAQ